ncbi:MAG: hypothetical protein WB817_03190 [Terriglobales bacterium]
MSPREVSHTAANRTALNRTALPHTAAAKRTVAVMLLAHPIRIAVARVMRKVLVRPAVTPGTRVMPVIVARATAATRVIVLKAAAALRAAIAAA